MLSFYFQLTCQNCRAQRVLSGVEMHHQLISLGKLRKLATPETEIMLELLRTSPELVNCEDCGSAAVGISHVSDEFDDLATRRCDVCNQGINPERLEIFPAAETCTACAAKITSEKTEHDYCALCGESMSLVTTNRRGITQYVSRCNGCGYAS